MKSPISSHFQASLARCCWVWTLLSLSCQNPIKSSLLSKFFSSASLLSGSTGGQVRASVGSSARAPAHIEMLCPVSCEDGLVFAAEFGPSFCLWVSSGLIGSMKASLSQLLSAALLSNKFILHLKNCGQSRQFLLPMIYILWAGWPVEERV